MAKDEKKKGQDSQKGYRKNSEPMLFVHALYFLKKFGPVKRDEFLEKFYAYLETNKVLYDEDNEITDSREGRDRREKVIQIIRNLTGSHETLIKSTFVNERDGQFEIEAERLVSLFSMAPGTSTPQNDNSSGKANRDQQRAEFIILFGPPGTGKTRELKHRVRQGGYYKIVQIHPSYTYEDLVEGIRPVNFSDGELRYDIVEGPIRILAHKAAGTSSKILGFISKIGSEFQLSLPVQTTQRYELTDIKVAESEDLLERAPIKHPTGDRISLTEEEVKKCFPNCSISLCSRDNPAPVFLKVYLLGKDWGTGRYALVLDEVNRGNLASLLGELVYLLGEEGAEVTDPVRLQYSQDAFFWPPRLSLFGTMNSSDVSTDRIDQAIKRRFNFEYVSPIPALFRSPDAKFPFLDSYNQKMKTAVDTFKELKTLNDLYSYFGSSITPDVLLSSINNLLLEKSEEFRVTQPSEKLLGHSYFIKLAERLCNQGNLPESGRQASLFFGFLLTVKEEVIPALVGVFHSDYSTLNRFLEQATSYHGKLDVNDIASLEKWVEKTVFGNDQGKVTALSEYKDLRKKKWPFAA